MKPTNKLRFVEREVVYTKETFGDGSIITGLKTAKVLQQWWANAHTVNIGFGEIDVGPEVGEWRDVPLEQEMK